MYITAKTYFLKLQWPNSTKEDWVNVFIELLGREEIINVSSIDGIISFKHGNWIGALSKYAPFFARFSAGDIYIVENEKLFNVYFRGSFKGPLVLLGISTTVMCIFFLIAGLPFTGAIGLPFFMFFWVGIGTYSMLKFQAGRHFKKLRDDIETQRLRY